MLIRRMFVAFSAVLFAGLLLALPAAGATLQPSGGASTAGGQVEGFVPVSELPAADQLPAAPLLVAAYAFVWIAAMVYLWSIWARLSRVEAEMRALEQRQRGQSR